MVSYHPKDILNLNLKEEMYLKILEHFVLNGIKLLGTANAIVGQKGHFDY